MPTQHWSATKVIQLGITILKDLELGMARGVPRSSFPKVPDLFSLPIPRGIDFTTTRLLKVLAKFLEDLKNLSFAQKGPICIYIDLKTLKECSKWSHFCSTFPTYSSLRQKKNSLY